MGQTTGYLVLDIETVPDGSLWSRPELALGQAPPFPPIYAHRVITVGCMWLDADYQLRRLGGFTESADGTDEAKECGILEDLSRFVGQHKPALVTYNGRSFDLPVIALRSLHHGVPIPWYYRDEGLRDRYSEEGHIDLCDWLADHGATRFGSLDALARLIGLPGKIGIDGSQVEGLYRAGKLQAIQNYCLADVVQTALLFLRFRLLQGVLPREKYCQIVADLTAELRDDLRICELMAAVNGARLLDAA